MRFKHLFIAIALVWSVSAWGMKWKPVPLEERLADAEVVVVGAVVELSTGAYSWSSHRFGVHNSTTIFDRGVIKVSEAIKGKPEAFVSVLFENKDQKMMHGHPPRSHIIGEQGIWLLKGRYPSGDYSLPGPPPNPLPLESRAAVREAIERKN